MPKASKSLTLKTFKSIYAKVPRKPKGEIRLNKEASDFDYFKKAPSDTIKEVKSFLKDLYG